MFKKYLKRISALGGAIKNDGNNNVIKAIVIGAVAISSLPGDVMAAQTKNIVQAKIINSRAVHQTITAYENQERCDEIRKKVASSGGGETGIITSTVGTLLGAVGGALIGRNFGGGNGNVAAQAIGGVVGAFGGNAAAKSFSGSGSDRDVYEVSTECRTEKVPVQKQILDGYDVEAVTPSGEKVFGRIDSIPNDGNIQVEETRTTSYRIKR